MDPKDILVLATKGTVLAHRRDTGAVLRRTHLKSHGFVSLLADENRVYAHTGGELFCLDLFTGDGVWRDEMKGLGYDLASMALPGMPADAALGVREKKRRDDAAAASASVTTTSSHS